MDPDLVSLAAEVSFSGVVGIECDGELSTDAFGSADRAHEVPVTVDHRFGIASGTKTLTALGVLSAIADGATDIDGDVRQLLGDDLPLIDDAVTVRQLLNHRSGIGDYLDENDDHDVLDHAMKVPVHTLDGAAGYLAAIDGYPQKFPAGSDFAYCNSGYVLLGIVLERATGTPYVEAIRDRVTGPAGMTRTEFLRMDSLPGDAAVGYLHADGLRTNVLHLPVVGFGDGGVFTTVGDVHRLWSALVDGRFRDSFTLMAAPPVAGARYGMGMWLEPFPGAVAMEGMDAGASFVSTRFANGTTCTVLSNTGDGAWPIARHLAERFGGDT